MHSYGLIQHELDKLVLAPAYRSAAHQRVAELTSLISEAESLLGTFIRLAGAPAELNAEAEDLQGYLLTQLQQLQQVDEALLLADDSLTLPVIPAVEVDLVLDKLEAKGFSNLVLGTLPRLKEVLRMLSEAELSGYATRLLAEQQPHNLLIFGRPATGKTHGVVRAVEQRLSDGYPALLVSARYSPAQNWHVLLNHALNGFTDWTAQQLFTALGAMAARVDVRRARAAVAGQALQDEPTRVLICLDGIDEVTYALPWQERVSELRFLLTKHPHLRFVVTSRAYPPANLNPSRLDFDATINRRLDLPHEGDVPLVDLATRYLEHYGIKYTSTPWLPEAFHDALSIRLFAIQYAGQDLADIDEPVTISLGGLLSYKIDQIEAEFTADPQLAFPTSQHVALYYSPKTGQFSGAC